MRRIIGQIFLQGWLLAFCLSANALNVSFDSRSPQEFCEWVDKSYVRDQMEVIAGKICKALYGGTPKERFHENFNLTLFLDPAKGGAPGLASGNRVIWRVNGYRKGAATSGLGLLGHEMTHVFDFNSRPMSVAKFRTHHDSKFIEATAVWVIDYVVKYGFQKCSSPETIVDRRYEALRHHREWGGYRAGAGFFDFVEQAYGTGTVNKLIWDMTAKGKNPWERVLGKNLNQLVEEWKKMETIYDPVFQWTYNGTANGARRNDKKFCVLKAISAADSEDKLGAWLTGVTGAEVKGADDGNITLALHGRFPKSGKVMIASLGQLGSGRKALLLTTTQKSNMFAAHVVASIPGRGTQIISTTQIPVTNLREGAHSVILTVKGGDVGAVVVDGKVKAKIDLKNKCGECVFRPVFAVGGILGGGMGGGFSEPNGEGGILLDDVRVFTRTFRSKETQQYVSIFGSDYRGGVAVEATWCGPQGGSDIGNPQNWKCYNAAGERVVAVPTKDTAVTLWFKALPSIPPNSKFACKSFLIDGLVIIEDANVDLRGVRIVDLADNTRIVSKNGRSIAVNALRAKNVRLDGAIAITGGMKISGNLEIKEGSSLKVPPNPEKTLVKSISVKGNGPVAIRSFEPSKRGVLQKLLRIETMPEDFSHFRLNIADGDRDATFKRAGEGKFLGVTLHK